MTNIMGDAQEDENVNMLVNMMGQAVSPEIARGVLRRHKGEGSSHAIHRHGRSLLLPIKLFR